MEGEGRLTKEACQRELPLPPRASSSSSSFKEGLNIGPQVVVSGDHRTGIDSTMVSLFIAFRDHKNSGKTTTAQNHGTPWEGKMTWVTVGYF